jgi:spore maturation protein CgeB
MVLMSGLEGNRILVVGLSAFPDSFEWHVVDSLRHLGCTVELFHDRAGGPGWMNAAARTMEKIATTLLREPERLREARLLRTARDFSPAVILVLLGSQVSPKTIEALRKTTKVPIVCWCQDQMTTLKRQYLLGSGYDAVFVKDRYMQDLFSRMIRSTVFHYLPEACNPRMHRPMPLSAAEREEYGCEVMLAGTLYYYRQEILQQLKDFDLKVWGSRPDWLIQRLPGRFMGRYVHGDDKVRAALAANICLNTLHYAEVDALNCRAFEIAGCGGFQLVTHVAVIAEHFEPEVEVATYRSTDELIEKIRHFLDHPESALAIARRGQLRAHRDHTYEHRLREILRIALGAAPGHKFETSMK